jgi:hypothetical protein
MPRSDETLLPERSENLGGVKRWRSLVALIWSKASLLAYGVKPVGQKSGAAALMIDLRRNEPQAQRRPG